MNAQRDAILEEKKEDGRQQRRADNFAAETGLNFPAAGISNLTPEQLHRLKNRIASQKTL